MKQPDRPAPPITKQSRLGIVGLVLITITTLLVKPDRALTQNCRLLLSGFTEACQRLRHA
ncbi:hypothetical protein ACWGVR_33960 [Streptomyces xanthophaeus]